MIDWSSKFGRKVKRHLRQEHTLWLTTVGPDLMPHPRPVWFVWDDDSILFFSQPHAHKVRHLLAHPQVALNFNTDAKGDVNVIVLLGTAAIDADAPPAHKVSAYLRKYREGIAGLKRTPEHYGRESSIAIRVTPTAARGW